MMFFFISEFFGGKLSFELHEFKVDEMHKDDMSVNP